MAQDGRDWVDYLTALLTPVIVFFGLIIAFFQWKTNRNRLKHELFDRRYKQFEIVNDFIGSILANGKVKEGEVLRLLSGIRGMEFIFDKELFDHVKEIQSTASLLTVLINELESATGEKRKEISRNQAETFEKLRHYQNTLEDRVSKYLRLRH